MVSKQHNRHILCFKMKLCLFVALSFIAPLLPVGSASARSDTMPCCAGKAGHCDSGIAVKKVPPPKSEPMCGLKDADLEDDGITIVAKPVVEPQHSHSQAAENTSSQPAAESASLSRPCHMDCGACTTSLSRQEKRERSIVVSNTHQVTSPTASSKNEDKSLLFSSSDNWPRINPRGPPAQR